MLFEHFQRFNEERHICLLLRACLQCQTQTVSRIQCQTEQQVICTQVRDNFIRLSNMVSKKSWYTPSLIHTHTQPEVNQATVDYSSITCMSSSHQHRPGLFLQCEWPDPRCTLQLWNTNPRCQISSSGLPCTSALVWCFIQMEFSLSVTFGNVQIGALLNPTFSSGPAETRHSKQEKKKCEAQCIKTDEHRDTLHVLHVCLGTRWQSMLLLSAYILLLVEIIGFFSSCIFIFVMWKRCRIH